METLRIERFLRRLSQERVAREAGLTQSTFSRIETGKREAKAEEKAAIAEALGLTAADLWAQEARP